MDLSERLKGVPLYREWTPRPEILLNPNTVKPLHGVVPRIILGKDWWDLTRKEAYRSTNYHCVACTVPKEHAKEFDRLEGHEVYKVNYSAGRATYLETVPLCHYCHCFVHCGRLKMMLDAGETTREKYTAVMIHGDHVLRAAGLKKTLPEMVKMPPWDKWRLVLFGKKYPPLYRTEAEWRRNFNIGQVED